MFTNDRYVAMLEKMASGEENDNTQIARKDYNENRQENRRYLGTLFDRADEVERQMTSAVHQATSSRNESGSPFIKIAREAFNGFFADTGFSKTASPTYREVAFRAFAGELEKLASQKPQTMAKLATSLYK